MENSIPDFVLKHSIHLAIIWSILITVLTLLPGSTIELFNLWGVLSFDKVGHFLLYAVYASILVVAFSSRSKRPQNAIWLILNSTAISIIFGIVLEFIQGIIPDRNFDFLDMIANIAGSIIGAVSIIFFIKIQNFS